jgi:hypothetical protein
MIKYFEFVSQDHRGNYIHSIEKDNAGFMMKTASNNYSPEIMEAIVALKRDPQYYYVVINALGSYEIWGANRNGDAFPRAALSHYSLRTDMGTKEDYGYKTFEYYAHLYAHHVNKDPNKGFGKVFFSSWNPRIERVELIVGIDKLRGADMIEAIEMGDLLVVSMGAKLPFDVCSICSNKARTTKEYCTHLKFYMGKVVTEEQAIKWSIELGKKVLPGASVHAWNHNPRFFDISKVFIGADSTSFSLGKVASKEPIIHSAILGEVEGVTDEQIDKLALLGKSSSIEKVIDGDSMNTGDGKMIDKGKAAAIRKMLDESFRKTITEEEEIPNQTLDTIANNFDLKQIFSTMMGMGIHPHPREVQRIIIIKTGYPDVANLLDERRLCFDDNEVVEDPIEMDIGNNNFDPAIAKMLMPMMLKRSCFPDYLLPRMEKKAEQNSPNPPLTAVLGPAALLAGIASLYAGLRLKAMGASNAQMFDLFRNQAWIPKMLGTGLSYKIMILDKQRQMDKMYVPARSYENAFFPSGFTGPLTKTSSVGGSLALGALGATLALPAGYVLNAYHRKSMYETGRGMFPGSGASPITVAGLVGGGTAAASLLKDGFSKDLFKKVVTKAK